MAEIKKYCCDEWIVGVDSINGILSVAHVMSAIPDYKGKPYVFCPWCGVKVEMKEVDTDEVKD